MLSDLRQLCVHHPCGLLHARLGSGSFRPGVDTVQYRLLYIPIYTRSPLVHSPQFPCPPRPSWPQSSCAFFAFSPLALHFHSPRAPADSARRSRQSRSSSILCFQTPPHSFFFRIPPNSCPLSQLRTLREKHWGWPPLVAGRSHRPLSPKSFRALAFHESQLTNHRSRSLSARRHVWCHKPAEVGV